MKDFGLNVIEEMIEKADDILNFKKNVYYVYIKESRYMFTFTDEVHGKNFDVRKINVGTNGVMLPPNPVPLFTSQNYPDSDRIHNILKNRKDELELKKRQKSVENDRAELMRLLGHNDPEYVKRHKDMKFVADEIVRAMNACEDKLTDKQRSYLAHSATLVIDVQLQKLGYLERVRQKIQALRDS